MTMLQRLRARFSGQEPSGISAPAGTPVPFVLDLSNYEGIEAHLDLGDIAAAVELVAQSEPAWSQQQRNRVELLLRHEAFQRAASRSPRAGQWPPRTERTFDVNAGLPEAAAEDLDRDAIVAGVRGHGALIVRGLFDHRACSDLRKMIDSAVDIFGEDRTLLDPDWNTPLTDLGGKILGAPAFRGFNFHAAGLAAADAPTAAHYIIEQFSKLGLPELVGAYLAERPALSLEKWTLRKVPPDTGSSWHQDGAFLGVETRTLNLWVALSDCGEQASGLDIVARRFDHIVPTGTPGAYFDWDVSPDVVDQERGSNPIVAPVFKAGDAVFFDQFLLHKTGTKPDLTEDRYALETWFFTPTSFPGHYSGLLL